MAAGLMCLLVLPLSCTKDPSANGETYTVSLDKTELTLEEGESQTLTAKVSPAGKKASWSIDKADVASVKDGVVKALKAGTAVITAKVGDSEAHCQLTVTAAQPDKFEMVDMGLSVKWANMNVGANHIQDAGNSYAWGETESKSTYSWKNYKWGEAPSRYSKKDGIVILYPEDDAAAASLGSQWRMPTKKEWDELRATANTTWEFTQKKGVKGFLITSKRTKNTIFLPTVVANEAATYWSASLSDNEKQAHTLFFEGQYLLPMATARMEGNAVRAVYGADFRIATPAPSLRFNAETFDVEIVSSVGYHITEKPEWITETGVKDAGLNRKVHTFSVTQNDGEESRSGIIVFCNDDQKCVPLTVTQLSKDGVDWNTPFAHHSLMLRFTATWCGWCPFMAEAVKKAQTSLPGKIIPLNVHASDSDLAFSQVSQLATQYKVGGYPSGIVDGRIDIPNYQDTDYTASLIVDAVNETESKYPVTSTIGIKTSFSASALLVDIDLFLSKAETYKYTAVITESNIINKQADNHVGAYVNDYQHDDIARIALTPIKGESVTVANANTVVNKKFTASIPASYKKENLKVVVYVQRAFGSQEAIASDNYGGYYVDNAAVVKAGETLEPAYEQ